MLTERDRQRLRGVHPVLEAAIEDVFAEMEKAGFPMFVVSGVRTEAEQAVLYGQGRRGAPGPIVTYKDGRVLKSDHQIEADGFGHAVDCAFLPHKGCSDCFAGTWPWSAFGDALERRGMVWGGRFKKPADLDHAQYVLPNEPSSGGSRV